MKTYAVEFTTTITVEAEDEYSAALAAEAMVDRGEVTMADMYIYINDEEM